MAEGNLFTGYDSRKEFTESLREQTDRLNEFFMRGNYPIVLKSVEYIFLTVRALFTTDEKTNIQNKIDEIHNLPQNRSSKDAYIRGTIDAVGLLFDALHAHKLLLPTYDNSEADEDDIESLLSEAGL